MEITKSDLDSSASSKKMSGNKSKVLYKFKISDDIQKKKLFMGQCFLIDLNFESIKNSSQSKRLPKLNKLPSILIGDKSKISDSLTLQRSQSQNKSLDYKFNPFKSSKKKPKPLNSFDIYSSLNSDKNLHTIQPETKNNFANDAFLKRINDRYYPKFNKIKYFTRLFEDNDKNDLKMIDLKKIKGNNKRKYLMKKDKENNYNFLYFRKNKIKPINTEEKLNDKANIAYKLTKEELDKQLKHFYKLRINNCKNKVNETLNDLIFYFLF